jgi:hypothetical protein
LREIPEETIIGRSFTGWGGKIGRKFFTRKEENVFLFSRTDPNPDPSLWRELF